MKVFFPIFLFCFWMNDVFAQDSAMLISNALIKADTTEINISRMDCWLFKEGNDSTWANGNINFSNWKKIKPEELTVNNANKDGRIEGWFRMKLKTDFSPEKMPLGFRYSGWGAVELFIDGKLLTTYGTIGIDKKSFHEYNPINRSAISLSLEPGKDHILAIHFVDFISTFPYPTQIKSIGFIKIRQYTFTNSLFSLTGSNFNVAHTNKFYTHLVFKSCVAAIILAITILFWLITYQNPKEINLRLISVFSTLGVVFAAVRVLWHSQSISFNNFMITQGISNILVAVLSGLIPIVIAGSLKQKIKPCLKTFLLLQIIFGIISFFYYSYLFTNYYIVLSVINTLISCYFIILSWKTIKGPQWSIVIGFGFLIFWNALSLLFIRTVSVQFFLLLEAFIFLSIPFAYVIYISMSFREIIKEVKENASKLILISEEKKELIASQNEMLEKQVADRTSELHLSLIDLKATQKQLIQSEKMASLGELTAGIAHEIQNPLNFVNNFSEVSTELVDEMNEEIQKGNLEDVQQIAADLKKNLTKINHHGKRAGDIVKGMLQHSRSSSGQKEPTDINALADEYLRLAYHGLRAKDKSFNATMHTNFDESIGKIHIIPQDIGRVILNLITNAFYVVDEKKKNEPANYEPTITVNTQKSGKNILISIKDNGNGIPKNILDKIFQPFFTTKPTGQGTGLGLSLSYDIVKAHGGELKVETKEGEGTEFIIEIPIV